MRLKGRCNGPLTLRAEDILRLPHIFDDWHAEGTAALAGPARQTFARLMRQGGVMLGCTGEDERFCVVGAGLDFVQLTNDLTLNACRFEGNFIVALWLLAVEETWVLQYLPK